MTLIRQVLENCAVKESRVKFFSRKGQTEGRCKYKAGAVTWTMVKVQDDCLASRLLALVSGR